MNVYAGAKDRIALLGRGRGRPAKNWSTERSTVRASRRRSGPRPAGSGPPDAHGAPAAILGGGRRVAAAATSLSPCAGATRGRECRAMGVRRRAGLASRRRITWVRVWRSVTGTVARD